MESGLAESGEIVLYRNSEEKDFVLNDELTRAEIDHRLIASKEDILAGHTLTQDETDVRMKMKLYNLINILGGRS